MGRVSIHRFFRHRGFRHGGFRHGFLRPGPWAAALVSTLALAVGPTGCAVGVGTGSGAFGSREGTFVDSAVEGIEYDAGGLVGTTDTAGHFLYNPGGTVTFFLGDIVIGSGPGAVVMTPVSLSEGAVDETDGTATNIARFLMTVDDDRDPTNGIQISDAVRAAAGDLADQGLTVNFGEPPSVFAGHSDAALGILSAATTAGGSTVSALTAQDHLRKTLLGLLAGSYKGEYTGDDSGDWEMAIDADGNVTGTAVSGKTADDFPLTGTVGSSGTDLEVTSGLGPSFKGAIAVDGSVSGNWQRLPEPGGFDGSVTQFGTFTGARE
jgi:hypothetical protein